MSALPLPLPPPREAELLFALRRQLGPHEGDRLWEAARRDCLPPDADALSVRELPRVARYLAAHSPSARVVARSFVIRHRAFHLVPGIEAREPDTPPAHERPAPDALPEVTSPRRVRAVADLALDRWEGGDDAVLAAVVGDVATTLELPCAAVCAVLDGAVRTLATVGGSRRVRAAGGLPVEWSYCRHVIETRDAVVLGDARHAPREATNPLARAAGMASYVGVPLTTRDGHVVGTLCALGPDPRRFRVTEVAFLERIAPVVALRLEGAAR